MSDISSILEEPANIKVELIEEFKGTDLSDLCDAAEATLTDSEGFTIGFSRDGALVREQLESYWKGILLVPDRRLIVGRLDGMIAASIQYVKPSATNHTSSFAASVENHFVAPWARGHGLARALLRAVERKARSEGIKLLKLSVRANLTAAVNLYEGMEYKHWGTLEKYEMIDGEMLAGCFYCKDL